MENNNTLIAEFMGLKVIPAGTKCIGEINHPEPLQFLDIPDNFKL